jgi:GTP pyrophosphokinase
MPSIRRKRAPRSAPPPVAPDKNIDFDAVLAELRSTGRPVDEEFLRAAYDFSAEMHGGQKRKSGELYLTHPVHVAYLLAHAGFDDVCVAVGLLHDVLEDTLSTREVLIERFGQEIAELVDGVTKIGQHEYVRRDEAQAETFRKLILASVKDLRVILVKLADRLHNMLTLEHLPSEDRRRISRETLEIYAPIAHRLGMARIQGDLEDLAFYHLYPKQYADLREKILEKLKLAKRLTEEIRGGLEAKLAEEGIEAEINFRVKRHYSIYRKLRRRGIDVASLYDYLAYRIVTQEAKDCYAILGVVHQNWRPVPGRFKDYIAMPKPNLYQSLHTTLLAAGGHPFEVQIRTREMDLVAEQGIAAHWRYKRGGDFEAADDAGIVWLRQLLEWQKEVKDARTFLTTLKVDLYPDEVYAFSPKGDVFSFPRGSTLLDFAYRIHTEVGHRCVGARINGKLVALRTPLSNGDIVEIVTSPRGTPSRDWLSQVVTSRATSKIRHWLNTEQKSRAMEIGRRLIERELKRHRVSPKKVYESDRLKKYLADEGLPRLDDLFSRTGFGKIPPAQVASRILSAEEMAQEPQKAGRLREAVTKILPSFGSEVVAVKGHSDLLAYLAKCCNPLPGEEIVGYVTRGRGVSVHSVECSNVKNLLYHPEREIEVAWAQPGDEVYPVVLKIETEDRPGILARLTEVIAKYDTNIRQIEAETEVGRGSIEIVMEVRNRKQLEKLRHAIGQVPGVLEARRRTGPVRLGGPTDSN